MKALKKIPVFLIAILISHTGLAQHFSTIWSGNPYQSMNIVIQDATLAGIEMESGDEIAVFDVGDEGDLVCVGMVTLTNVLSPQAPALIVANENEPGGSIEGFTIGNNIVFKLWDSSKSAEIVVSVPSFITGYDTVYTSLGTAVVSSLVGYYTVETTASNETTCQGSVVIPIVVSNLEDISIISLQMSYLTTNLTYTGYQNINSQASGLSVSENAGDILVSLNTATPVNISSDTLVELLFNAGTVFSQVTESLTWDSIASYYETDSGITLNDQYNDGIITINPIPIGAGTINGESEVCKGTTNVNYSISAVTNATTIIWNLNPTSAGTIVGSGTGITIDFSDTYSGTVVLSVYGSNSCSIGASSSKNINVIPNPTADAGSDTLICGDDTYTLSGTATNQQSVLWTTNGDGTFDDATIAGATYSPGSDDITNGIATLTLTAYAITPCAVNASDEMVLSIQPIPTANANSDATICEDDTYTLSGTASNQQSVLWTTSGDGTFDDSSILNPVYTPGVNDVTNGSVDLTLTSIAILPCTNNAFDDMLLTIQSLPLSNAGDDTTICGDDTYTLLGVVSNQQSLLWTTNGDGAFDDATIAGANYTPGSDDITNGIATLTLTAYATSPCAVNASDEMVLSIQPIPTANANSDATICEDDTYTLSGTASNQQSVLWTTNGDGTFDDATILNPVYTPGVNDVANGSVVLTLTSIASLPCANNATDNMNLTIGLLPIADAGSDDHICINTPSYFIGNASAVNNSSLLWATSGDGTFDDATLVNPIYSPGPYDIANYNVILSMTAFASAPCTADNVDSMVLNFSALPIANAGINDTIILGQSITLDGTASSGTEPYSYSWTPVSTLSNSYISNPIATPDTTTTYTLSLNDSYNCSAVDSVEIYVDNYFTPIWSNNPYQPMNIIINRAMLDGINLSMYDEIGIFDIDDQGNEICVGLGIVNDSITTSNPLLITVSADDINTTEIDGFTEGNTIIFKVWSSTFQTVYTAYQASFSPLYDELYAPFGTAMVEVWFFDMYYQTIDFVSGWNIMSFYVAPTNMDMINIMQPLIASSTLTKVINEEGGFVQYIYGYGWMNTIGNMANTEGYYIKVTDSTSIDVLGNIVTLPLDIPLLNGWNMMGYPKQQPQDAISILQPLIDAGNLIKVINEAGGFIQNIPGYGWFNSIGNFEPGEGYYMKVNTNTSIVLNESVSKSHNQNSSGF